MSNRSNFTFLKLSDRWLNMNRVTDVRVFEDRVVVRFAAPMARRLPDGGVVTDTLRVVLRKPEDRAAVTKWVGYKDVTA